MRKTNKQTGRLINSDPLPTKNGVKVYYDGRTEAFLREQAKERGFRNVQEMLKFDAIRAREKAERG